MLRNRKARLITGAVAVLAVGGLIGGGIAWAAIAPPPTPLTASDTMYACVSSAGAIQEKTIKLNVAPGTCPKATDTVKSWTAQTDLSNTYTKAEVNALLAAKANAADTYTKTEVDSRDTEAARCKEYPHLEVDWSGCFLVYANLSGANLAGANLTNAQLQSANLTGANLPFAGLSGATLVSANLTSATLVSANLTSANLVSANLTGANLSGANLSGATLVSANLTGANLTNANLTNARLPLATLTGVTWSNTTCPDGSNSDSHGGTCIGYGI